MNRKTIHKIRLTSDDVRCALIEYVVNQYNSFSLGPDAGVDVKYKDSSLDVYDIEAEVTFENSGANSGS